MPVDHFGYTQSATFNMKFLYNNSFWSPGNPIFFYPGNEGYVESFADNTGIMWDLAKQFNASVVFAEHRYYSENVTLMPFGELAYTDVKYLGYLTTEQVLADYAQFVPWFKKNVLNCSSDTPVIAFGGSYGGMLAAWFRMKYPAIVNGSWAGSAPVVYFQNGGIPLDAFDHRTTQTLVDSGCNKETIINAFKAVNALSNLKF
uniref:Lysosomal Pro-X carboxypeptidase n=1 Tax=Acrobeloides nanus TaxID=290746 RepID=A0A914CP63_9BILA